MKEFENLEVEIISYQAQDVVVASGHYTTVGEYDDEWM